VWSGHAGAVLLAELADRLGLPGELDRWAGRGQPARARRRKGRVLTDLAVMLADDGDCLSDLVAERGQAEWCAEQVVKLPDEEVPDASVPGRDPSCYRRSCATAVRTWTASSA
jgi:hypothetical protein